MQKPAIPKNEEERIKALDEHEIPDTFSEAEYDELSHNIKKKFLNYLKPGRRQK